MKEYDIYLKRRLTEGTLFIQSLSYRDGLTITYRLLLKAMLDYYTLQKVIAIKNESVLVAEVGEIINTIHELIGSDIELKVDADFFVRYRNELEANAIEIGLPNIPSFLKSFFEVENAIEFSCGVEEQLLRPFNIREGIVITSEMRELMLHSIVHSMEENGIGICSVLEDTDKQIFEVVDHAIELNIPEVGLFYCYTTGLEHVISIAAEIVGDLDIRYSLGDVNWYLPVVTDVKETSIQKFLTVQNDIPLFCDASATVISYLTAESQIQIETDMLAGLKRKRWVSEVAGLSRDESGAMSLQEFFYVTLE